MKTALKLGKVQVGSQMIEVNDPPIVQIVINGKRLWVNVDGVCRLRAVNVANLEIERDGSNPKPGKILVFENQSGQGQEYAKKYIHSVVIACTVEDALQLSDLFLHYFAMRSCLHYDGRTLAMCYSEAGSGSEALKMRIEAFTEGYFKGKENELPRFLHRD